MQIFNEIKEIQEVLKVLRHDHSTIGLVPTMGALHLGHTSLIEASIAENDVTIASIFVNPTQFNNAEDLENYPQTLDKDLALLETQGCDFVFVPSVNEIYPEPPILTFNFGALEKTMEGAFRPGHFNGVALIISKLLHLINPDVAYFGQKDLQQFKIIERLVKDTSMNIGLRMMPILREDSGLAMSSRNKRLSAAGKRVAANIYQALLIAKEHYQLTTQTDKSIHQSQVFLGQFESLNVEYLTWVNLKDLQPIEIGNEPEKLVLCFAGYIEGIRLIDNLIVDGRKGY